MRTGEERIVVGALDRLVAALVYRQARGGLVGRLALHAVHLLGTDVLPRAVGPGLRLPHSTVGAVVHPHTVLGSDVTLWHGVTLGRADVWRPASDDTRIVVGDEVIFGANSVCLVRAGECLTIGDRAVIGAGSVVTTDVPAGEIWVGNPARRVGTR